MILPISNHIPSFNRENSLGERVSRFISDEVQLNWDYNTVTVGQCSPFHAWVDIMSRVVRHHVTRGVESCHAWSDIMSRVVRHHVTRGATSWNAWCGIMSRAAWYHVTRGVASCHAWCDIMSRVAWHHVTRGATSFHAHLRSCHFLSHYFYEIDFMLRMWYHPKSHNVTSCCTIIPKTFTHIGPQKFYSYRSTNNQGLITDHCWLKL